MKEILGKLPHFFRSPNPGADVAKVLEQCFAMQDAKIAELEKKIAKLEKAGKPVAKKKAAPKKEE